MLSTTLYPCCLSVTLSFLLINLRFLYNNSYLDEFKILSAYRGKNYATSIVRHRSLHIQRAYTGINYRAVRGERTVTITER